MLNTNPAEWSMHGQDTENCPNTKKERIEGTEKKISLLVKKRNQDIQENVQKKIIFQEQDPPNIHPLLEFPPAHSL